jgi:hypothetical protein
MAEEMLVYPTEKVVGVVDTSADLDRVNDALTQAGVAGDRVEVLCGDGGQERLDPDEHGKFEKMVRTVQKAFGDEAVRLEKLNEEIEAGNYVVQVGLSEEDDDAREDEKHRVGDAMRRNGARSIAFYGKHQIQELTLDA